MTEIILTLVFISVIIASVAAYLVLFLVIKPSINCVECVECETCHKNIVGDDFFKLLNVVNSEQPYSVKSGTIDGCKTTCKNTDTCAGFAYEPKEQKCSFYTALKQLKSSVNHDTFIKLNHQAKPEDIIWHNIDNYLASTENSLQTTDSAEDCKTKCLATPACKAYTIIENPTGTEFACNLHNELDTRRVLEKTARYNTMIKATR